jgi:hypothetical protein
MALAACLRAGPAGRRLWRRKSRLTRRPLSCMSFVVIDFVSLPPAERCAAILRGLHALLVFQGHGRFLGLALLRRLSMRVRDAADRIAALGAQVAAGTLRLPPPRERPPRPDGPAAAGQTPAAAAPTPPAQRLPGWFGWLLRRSPGVVSARSQLGHLLHQPDMAALIAAAPPVAGQLRPICRMLGLKPPPGLFPPRPRRRRRAPPAATAATPPSAKRTPKRPPPRRAVPGPVLYAAPQFLPPPPPPWRPRKPPPTAGPLRRG